MPSPDAYVPRDRMFLWWLADPAAPRLVGTLDLVNRGRDVAFRYAQDWLADGLPLSEDLPLDARPFLPTTPDTAAGAVDDARPDRWGDERNHALVHDGGSYRLSPAFDVLPAMRNLAHQSLRVGTAQMDSTLDNAMSECAAFGLTKDAAVARVHEICHVVDGWRTVMAAEGVAGRDLDSLSPFLDGNKAALRREQVAAPRKRRR